MLDNTHKPTVYLSLAENYEKLLEAPKATASGEHAAEALQAIYRHEHNWCILSGRWLLANVPPLLGLLAGYFLMLHNDLFKKVATHFTSKRVLKWWPNAEFAEAVGKPLPTATVSTPAALPGTPPALPAPGTDKVCNVPRKRPNESPPLPS